MNVETVLKINHDVRFRLLDEEGIIVRQETGEVIAVNEVGAAFLGLIDGSMSIAEIIEKLENNYDVDAEALRKDVLEFAEELTAAGVVALPGP